MLQPRPPRPVPPLGGGARHSCGEGPAPAPRGVGFLWEAGPDCRGGGPCIHKRGGTGCYAGWEGEQQERQGVGSRRVGGKRMKPLPDYLSPTPPHTLSAPRCPLPPGQGLWCGRLLRSPSWRAALQEEAGLGRELLCAPGRLGLQHQPGLPLPGGAGVQDRGCWPRVSVGSCSPGVLRAWRYCGDPAWSGAGLWDKEEDRGFHAIRPAGTEYSRRCRGISECLAMLDALPLLFT